MGAMALPVRPVAPRCAPTGALHRAHGALLQKRTIRGRYNPGMSDTPSRQAAWSRYWRQGALHSLPDDFDGNYAGPIRAFWLRQFETLAAGDRVLDIGTGNGALPQLVCEACATAMPQVDAIDLADVAPGWLAAQPPTCREALRFHCGVSAGALPFEDDCFDLVASQYGFEYCDRSQAVPELVRVLKPGGRLALLLHHAGSRLAEVAREELRLGDWLQQPNGVLDRFEAVVPLLAQATTAEGRARLVGDAAANATRDAFNQAMQALGREAGASPVPDLLHEARASLARLLETLGRNGDAATVLRSCRDYREALRDARLRHAELVECAMDAGVIDSFAGLLAGHGFTSIEHAPIAHDNGMLMGWTLTAWMSGAQARSAE